MGAMVSQITCLTIVYTTVYSDSDQRKYQSSASLAFVAGEFPAQMASNAENVSIWWRHHATADVRAWMSKYIPLFCLDVITHPYHNFDADLDNLHLPKRPQWPLLLTRFNFNPSMDI